MSFRNVDRTAIDLIRTMQSDIESTRRDQGEAKLNTIRLGDWVIEALDDHIVKMTNVVTKDVSYVGGPSEFPTFSYPGEIGEIVESPAYLIPYDATIREVVVTVGTASTALKFSLAVNGTSMFTQSAEGVYEVSIPVVKGDKLTCQIHATGGSNLAVTARL